MFQLHITRQRAVLGIPSRATITTQRESTGERTTVNDSEREKKTRDKELKRDKDEETTTIKTETIQHQICVYFLF